MTLVALDMCHSKSQLHRSDIALDWITQFHPNIQGHSVINGKIGSSHKLENGVKQGDALRCSLFILDIESLIRNIENNINVARRAIDVTWPQVLVLGYADNITKDTNNNNEAWARHQLKKILISFIK